MTERESHPLDEDAPASLIHNVGCLASVKEKETPSLHYWDDTWQPSIYIHYIGLAGLSPLPIPQRYTICECNILLGLNAVLWHPFPYIPLHIYHSPALAISQPHTQCAARLDIQLEIHKLAYQPPTVRPQSCAIENHMSYHPVNTPRLSLG